MNAKIYVFVICGEAIIYLLLCSLHDCTFKFCSKECEIKVKKNKVNVIVTIITEYA